MGSAYDANFFQKHVSSKSLVSVFQNLQNYWSEFYFFSLVMILFFSLLVCFSYCLNGLFRAGIFDSKGEFQP